MRRQALKTEVYIKSAEQFSRLSKDSSGVGAIIISASGEPLAFGYNGPPPCYDDEVLPKGKEAEDRVVNCYSVGDFHIDSIFSRSSKYNFAIHAERNAIRYATRSRASDLEGSHIFVTRFPCASCALEIAAAGISHVHCDLPLSMDEDSGVQLFYCLHPENKGGLTSMPINSSLEILIEAGVTVWLRNQKIEPRRDRG